MFLLAGGAIVACDDCTDCGPVVNDPNFSVSFYSKSGGKAVEVGLESVNNVTVNQLDETLRKKGATFRFPLSPAGDTSSFDLTFTEFSTEIPDTVTYKKKLVVVYTRDVVESMGAIKIKAAGLRVILHDFDSIAPAQFDPLIPTNNAVVKAYF